MARTDYEVAAAAIDYIHANYREQPTLAAIADSVALSPYHFQRLFRRWAGISPKRFVQYLTADYARSCLAGSRSVLDAALEAGLSGSGRLHDLTVNLHAATPGEIKTGGAGLTIRAGFHRSPFGDVLVGLTSRGICHLRFVTDDRDAALAELEDEWPGANIVRDTAGTRDAATTAFGAGGHSLDLYVKGTNFQVKVWEALIAIPPGDVLAYGDVARAIGQQNASRAVGTAIGSNPIAWIIPCHRVIRASGDIGGYRWSPERKRAMLAWEAAQRHAGDDQALAS